MFVAEGGGGGRGALWERKEEACEVALGFLLALREMHSTDWTRVNPEGNLSSYSCHRSFTGPRTCILASVKHILRSRSSSGMLLHRCYYLLKNPQKLNNTNPYSLYYPCKADVFFVSFFLGGVLKQIVGC